MVKKAESKNPGAGSVAEAPAEPAAVETEKKLDRKVTPCDATRIKQVEFLRQDYLHTAYEGTRPDDLTDPAYWAHISTQLRPRDRIEAWANDGTWMAEYAVLESGRNWARVSKLREHFFTASDTAMSQADALSPFRVEYAGPSTLWRVVRKADSKTLHEGAQTQESALGWLAGHIQAQR